MVQDERKFFCSELVAKAYKVCRIMKDTPHASQNFLPASLTSESKMMELVEGATLRPEKLIFTENMFSNTK